MSLEIDPDSINLGKDDPAYFAEYVSRPAPAPGSDCELPSATPITFNLPSVNPLLTPLNDSCFYQFNDVPAIPPTYYPPPRKPFPACEKFGASTDIQFLHLAAKNSFLVIEAGGPVQPDQTEDDALTDNAPNDCSLRVTGKFDIEACDKIETTSAVNIGENLAGALNLITVENCGVAIVGDLQYTGCPYYNVQNKVTFAPLFAGSSLGVTAKNENPCELTIDGFFDADVCEEFSATNSVNITGTVVKNQKSTLQVRDKNPCGFDFKYSADIVACDSVNVDGTVSITGDSKCLKVNKPITLTRGGDAPNCSLELDGDLELLCPPGGCKKLEYSDTSTIYGRSVVNTVPKYFTVAPSSDDNPVCGVNIGGAIEIQACPTYPTKYINEWYQVKELVTLKLPLNWQTDPVAIEKYKDALLNGNVYGPNGAVPGSTLIGKEAVNINFIDGGKVASKTTVQALKYAAPPVVKQVSRQIDYNYPACGSLVGNYFFTDVCSEVYLDFPYTPQQMSTITIYGADGSVGRGSFKVSAAAENAPGTPRGCGKSIYLMASQNVEIYMDYDDNGDGTGDIYGGDASGGGKKKSEDGSGSSAGASSTNSAGSGKKPGGGPCNFGCMDEGATGATGLYWDDASMGWKPYTGASGSQSGASGASGVKPLIRPARKTNVALELRDLFVNNIYPAQSPCCLDNGMMIDVCKGVLTGIKKMQIARSDGRLWDMPIVPRGAEPKWMPIMMCDGEGKKSVTYVLGFAEPTKQNWYEGSTGASATFALKDGVRGYYDKTGRTFTPYSVGGATGFSGASGAGGSSGASGASGSWDSPGDKWDNPFANIA